MRNPTFEPIDAAQNDLFVDYVGLVISKQKHLIGAGFFALWPTPDKCESISIALAKLELSRGMSSEPLLRGPRREDLSAHPDSVLPQAHGNL